MTNHYWQIKLIFLHKSSDDKMTFLLYIYEEVEIDLIVIYHPPEMLAFYIRK